MELINETQCLLNETRREIEDPSVCEARELPEDFFTKALMIDFTQSAGDMPSDSCAPFPRLETVSGACFLCPTTPLLLLLTGPLTAHLAIKYAIPGRGMEPSKGTKGSKERLSWRRLGLPELGLMATQF